MDINCVVATHGADANEVWGVRGLEGSRNAGAYMFLPLLVPPRWQAVVEDEEPGTRDAPGAASGDLAAAAAAARALRRTPPAAVTRDAAVLSLLAEAEADCHGSLADLLREHTFVGIVSVP